MAMLGRRDDGNAQPRGDSADIDTILGKGAKFAGRLSFEGAVRIDGRFEGDIETSDLLLVGPLAEVRGELRVGRLVVHGFVEGNIHASDMVELRAPGRLRGNVHTPNLHMEKGVRFDGTCRMSEDAEVPTMKVATRAPDAG
jgi:cytoskeletal protein CcmA (bactofilin family)